MHYLGGLHGEGHLNCGDDIIVRTAYDFEIFQLSPSRLAGCGEIRSPRGELTRAAGCSEFCLVTDDGRKLQLSFSDRNPPAQGDVAHVDVIDGLPPLSAWPLSLSILPTRRLAPKRWPKQQREESVS